MKNLLRVVCLVLVLAALLCSCANTAPTTTPTPAQTQAETTLPPAPLVAEVTNQEELVTAFAEMPRIILASDIQLTQTVGMKGRILDGGGYTITCQELQYTEVEDENGKKTKQRVPETEDGLMVCSGTVENLNIKGAYRCLGDSETFPMVGDVRIKNVTADGQTLAMAFGRGGKNGALYVENSTLRGWVLINRIQDARFENCTFGFNSEGKNGYFRPYRDVSLVNCRFENLVDENGKVTRYNISFYKSTKGVILTLENCYVGDTLITQDNVNTLLKVSNTNNTIVVRNTTN